MPDQLLNTLAAEAAENWELKLLLTVVVILTSAFVKWLTVRIIKKRVSDPTVRLVWSQVANASIILILLVTLSWVWLEGVGSILALLTLVAAAMTIVHKELILNFSSWSIIAWRSLFKLGDHIEIGPHTGRVIDLGPMYFTLSEATGVDTGLRPTGRTIRVPNAMVATHPVINYTDQGLRWIDVVFAVPSDSKWEEAYSILEQVIREEAAETKIDHSNPADLTVTVQVKDSKVVFTAHYPTKPRERLSSQTRVTREILNRFSAAGIPLV